MSVVRPAEPLHPDFVVAMRAFYAEGLPYAEMWRLLIPVAAGLGIPRPSYWRVREFLVEERIRREALAEEADRMLRDFSRGYLSLPRVVQHKGDLGTRE
jgi:hypothetical protein